MILPLMMRLFQLLVCLFLWFSDSFSASIVGRGVAVGIPWGATSTPGLVLNNTGLYFSEPQGERPSSNSMAVIPALNYSTKTRWFDNQFRFIFAPALVWKKNEKVGHSWHYGITSPVGLAGLVHEIMPGLGIAGYVGGMAPMRAGVSKHNEWTFFNLSSLTYNLNDYDITLSVIYGNPGRNLTTNIKERPNFLNLDFTCTKKFSGVEFGPIWYSSQDLNMKNPQHQFALGGLLGFDVYGWLFQVWFGHDLFAYNYPQQTMNGYFRLKRLL